MPQKCKKHNRYQAKRKPRVACEGCWRLWFETEEQESWAEFARGQMAQWDKEDEIRAEFEREWNNAPG